MTPDEIYTKCAQLSEIEIPEDLHLRGISDINKIISEIRVAMNFAGKYQNLAKQELSKRKNKLNQAKHLVKVKLAEDLRNQKYVNTVKSYAERIKLLQTEAEVEYGIDKIQAEVDDSQFLYQSIHDTYENVKQAKQQLNGLIKAIGDEKLIAAQGGVLSEDMPQKVKF